MNLFTANTARVGASEKRMNDTPSLNFIWYNGKLEPPRPEELATRA